MVEVQDLRTLRYKASNEGKVLQMRNKILTLVSVSLASVIALSGCSPNDKLSDGKWVSESSDGKAVLKVTEDDFLMKFYSDGYYAAKLAGKINRPKRALEIHEGNWGIFGSSSTDSGDKDDIMEYKFEDDSLIIRDFANKEEMSFTKD